MNKIRHILIYLFTSISALALGLNILNAQIITDKTYFNFGEIEASEYNYIDFRLTNASQDNIGILKYELPYGFSVRFSSKTIAPDQTVLVRIKYTPKRKGNFKGDINVFVSSNSRPIVLTVEGKAVSADPDQSLDVPEFEEVNVAAAGETFSLDIRVIRKADTTPVDNARIDLIWDGVMYRSLFSDVSGIAKGDFTPDKYYLVVNAEGLGSFESELSIHNGIRELVIELGPAGTMSGATEDSAVTYQSVITDTIPTTTEASPEDKSTFSSNEYKANNIVFLIDVSVSMKQKGRMNLLKASLIELTDLLRPVDKVAIVTYSSRAVLALRSTPASEKDKIKKVIQELDPKGTTAGSKGIKKAYQVLNDNEIKGGNNQVFISTDGAFNFEKQDKDLIDIAIKNAAKGYKISVIGIKNDRWTVKNMKKLAEEGNGNYLHITTYNDARSKLVDEVRFQSRNGAYNGK